MSRDRQDELLRRLYAGVSIRALRQQYQLEPWDILHRHHNLPHEQYHAVRRQLGFGACAVRIPECDAPTGERTA